jgi:MFS family permease
MSHTKCPRCGLDNRIMSEVCERCGAPLDGDAREESAPESARPAFPLPTLGSDVMTGQASRGPQEPPVWKWYVAYCAVIAIMNLLMIIGMVFFAIAARSEMNQRESQESLVLGLIYIGAGLLFLAPYAAAPFLPRRRWAWVMGVVLIGIGMPSICCWPVVIPLLIFWLKPENKAFFGVGSMANDNPYKLKEEPDDLGMILKMFAAGGLYMLALIFAPILLIIGWLTFGFYGVAFVLVASLILIVWRVFRDKSSDTPSLNLNSRD